MLLSGMSHSLLAQIKEPSSYQLGVGINLLPLILNVPSAETKSSPLFDAGVNYFLDKHLSIGPAFSYQSVQITDTGSSVPAGQSPFIRFNRITPGIKVLAWYKPDLEWNGIKRFSVYAGVRLSYDLIRLSGSNIRLSSGFSARDFTVQRFTRQLLLGGRVKVQNRWGFFADGAIGAPYLFQVGIFFE